MNKVSPLAALGFLALCALSFVFTLGVLVRTPKAHAAPPEPEVITLAPVVLTADSPPDPPSAKAAPASRGPAKAKPAPKKELRCTGWEESALGGRYGWPAHKTCAWE